MDYSSIKNRPQAASDDQIRRFEGDFAIVLPNDYRTFLKEVNGGRLKASFNDNMDFEMYRLFSLHSPESETDLALENEMLRDYLPEGWISIGETMGGSRVVLRTHEARGPSVVLASISDSGYSFSDLGLSFAEFLASLRSIADDREVADVQNLASGGLSQYLKKVNQLVDGDPKIGELLLEVVKYGNLERTREMLSMFPDTPTCGLLHVACKNRHFDIVKLLIEIGADPQELDTDEMKPIDWVRYEDDHIREYLAAFDE